MFTSHHTICTKEQQNSEQDEKPREGKDQHTHMDLHYRSKTLRTLQLSIHNVTNELFSQSVVFLIVPGQIHVL